MKTGKKYYSLYIDRETLKHEWSEWYVRTIRGGWVYLIQKNYCTWGKLSKKHGHAGWLENIPDLWRAKFAIRKKPESHFTTKKQAWHHEYKRFKAQSKGKYWYWNAEETKQIEKKYKRIKPK